MPFNLAPPPKEFTLTDTGLVGRLTRVSEQWFLSFIGRLQNASYVVATPSQQTGQHTSIASTPLAATAVAGTFRVSAYVRVSAPAGVSSSIALAIGWTDDGVALTKTLIAALTGNATTTFGDGAATIMADAGSLTYNTTYASNPANAMQYKYSVIAEALG